MNLLRILIFCLLSVSVAMPAFSQVTVVSSKKKTVIDGKSFFLHTVQHGETLYSISKVYNVLQKDIVFNNPDAFEGIKIGQELKIPVKAEVTQAGNRLQSAQFIYHITEKGQTIYWLTQQYQIAHDELLKYNPDLEHSPLQTGQVVTIPKKSDSSALPPKPQTGFAIHTVKRKETLFSITKSYQVDLNEILEINSEIDANNPKLKIGQKIKIPLSDAEPIGIPVETSQTDTIIIRKDLPIPAADTISPPEVPFAAADTVNCAETTQTQFRIAMMLPFFLADNAPASAPDSSLTKDAEGRFRYKDGRYWIHPRSTGALEFYEGALLAIDSLKKQGLNAQIYCFDTMRDTVKMAQLLNSPAIKEMDLIIGPFSTELVNQTRAFANENNIYYVSPVAINAASLKNNPFLMQVNTGEINTVNPIVEHITKQENIHITLIGNGSEADQTLFDAYQNKLKTLFSDSILTVHHMRLDSLQSPSRYLKKKQTNVVIIPSADEAFVNIVTGQLNSSSHNFHINLYGLAGWTKFINLDQEYLYTLEFHYATAFYIDHEKSEVQRFLQQFHKIYGTEPTMLTANGGVSPYAYQFAFLGYDIARYFGSAMQKYGKSFGHCIQTFRLPTLQSDFHFEKIDSLGGYRNTHLEIYKYGKDYIITKENAE